MEWHKGSAPRSPLLHTWRMSESPLWICLVPRCFPLLGQVKHGSVLAKSTGTLLKVPSAHILRRDGDGFDDGVAGLAGRKAHRLG